MNETPVGQRSHRAAVIALSLALVAVVIAGGLALRASIGSGRLSAAGVGPGGKGGGSGGSGGGGEGESVAQALDAARDYIRQQKAGSAVAILRSATEKWPNDQALRLLLGEALLSQGRGAEAYDQYDLAIHIGPDNPEYRHVAATIASAIGRFTEAEIHYRAAQQADPRNPKFPLFLAQVQRKQGLDDEARASLLLATRLDPTLGIAWASLAALALDENRPSVALGYIRRAREVEPERLDWRVIEARALLRENNPQQAADLLMAVAEGERMANSAALREVGSALALLGRTSEAAAMFAKAVAARPDDAELAYDAALWLERDGQRGRAATFASHAAAMGYAPAKALAQRLDGE